MSGGARQSRDALAAAEKNPGAGEEYSGDDDDGNVPGMSGGRAGGGGSGSGGPPKAVRPSGEELVGAFGVTEAGGKGRCPFGFDQLAAAADQVLEVSVSVSVSVSVLCLSVCVRVCDYVCSSQCLCVCVCVKCLR